MSRTVPSEAGTWARRIPSKLAPSRSIAARERASRASVFRVTRSTPQPSNACPSSSSLHSELTAVRCTAAAYHVLPTSATVGASPGPGIRGRVASKTARSRKRCAGPTTSPVARSTTANGTDVPAACSASAVAT